LSFTPRENKAGFCGWLYIIFVLIIFIGQKLSRKQNSDILVIEKLSIFSVRIQYDRRLKVRFSTEKSED